MLEGFQQEFKFLLLDRKTFTFPLFNWKVLLDIFSAMDGVSYSSPNGYLWVGLSQKYQQVFFTSKTKPAELRKSVPRRDISFWVWENYKNLVKTDLSSISTITWVVRASPVLWSVDHLLSSLIMWFPGRGVPYP
ncbi:uncharacterized protein TNIN_6591 [Trichonephila inaurata madagascariensis]|uniref:Uncharacterized protein n=1 Tax=Trichonephila inaurata madagascariensis TaxID=2747483 RepID=A0A8X7C7M0_9ARAC|nr:uncharacterized protein TNIN_6591 [Trichonephila inaurata madagascariensis]